MGRDIFIFSNPAIYGNIRSERQVIYMPKRMSWDEIKKAYPNQWVGLTDVEWKDTSNIKSPFRHIHIPKFFLYKNSQKKEIKFIKNNNFIIKK